MSTSRKNIQTLKEQIQSAKNQLDALNSSEPIPELINSTNLLRTNEFLTSVNAQQKQLLLSFDDYVRELEKLATSIIKSQLKSLKKSKSTKKPPKRKSKRKTKRKIRKIKRKTTKKRKKKR